MTRGERALGIFLGVLLGIGIVVAFVFLGSEDTVDAPSLEGQATQTAPQAAPPPASPKKPGVPLVRVVAGKPPASGPPKLEFEKGDRIRFRVRSDSAIGAVEVMGLGRSLDVPSGRTVTFDFPARRTGLFAVLVSASRIAIATIEVRG